MNASQLLERESLLQALDSHAAAAAAGNGRLVFVGGEAGAGKTTLVRAFVARHGATATVLSGACDPMTVPRPLAPLIDFASSVGDEFAALVDAGGQREWLFRTLLERLMASKRLDLVVLEDLHWADDATLDLLRYLGRRLAPSRTLLVGTYRDDEVGPGHPLRRVLGDLAGADSVHRVAVPLFSVQAVAQLAVGTDVDAADLHRRTGGNPFFVTEVLAAGGTGLPAKVEDAVLARTARLSPPAREALVVAAVIGQHQELRLLERLAPSVRAVEECLTSGMLSGKGQVSSFRHELAREAVLGAMTASNRRLVHALVLAAIEKDLEILGASGDEAVIERYPPEVLPVLAHHADGAGDEQRVLRYAPAAGRLAFQLKAFREAMAQFARALPYAARLGTEGHVQLLELYARASGAASHDVEADDACRQVLELWQRNGDPARVAVALASYAMSRFRLGHKETSDRLSREAVALADTLPEGPERATAYQGEAYLRMLDRDTDEALLWGRRAVASGRRTGNFPAMVNAYNALVGALTTSERIADARRYHRALLELLRGDHGLDEALGTSGAKSMLGTGLGEVYRFREAEGLLSEAIDISSQYDIDSTHYYAAAWRALTHLYLGRWRECGEAAGWLLSRPNASLITRIMAGVALGRLRIRRGDPEVWPVLDVALEEAVETDTLQRLAPVRAARAEAALAAGANDRAQAEASAALPLAVEHRHRWFVGELCYLIWRAGGDPDLPDWVDGPFASQVHGRPLEAARAWHRLGCPYEEARALSEVDEPQALLKALGLLTALGAKPAAAKAAERLRQRGVRGIPRGPRSATRADPTGLTPRERQVLRLLVQGLKNSEIAERNRVSRRTVDSQVSAILAKLDVRSRTEAVATAHRLGLVVLADENA